MYIIYVYNRTWHGDIETREKNRNNLVGGYIATLEAQDIIL